MLLTTGTVVPVSSSTSRSALALATDRRTRSNAGSPGFSGGRARWLVGALVALLATSGQLTGIEPAAASQGTVSGPLSAESTQAAIPGGTYSPLVPARILDTRSGVGRPNGAGTLGIGTIDLTVIGVGGVPTTDVDAVLLNLTVVEPTSSTYLTAFPAGAKLPNASNLNTVTALTAANLVTVKVGAGGKISLYNAGGRVHLIADVQGWYSSASTARGGRLQTVAPQRLLDTRSTAPVGVGQVVNLRVTGVGGVPKAGVSAVSLNVTAVAPAGDGYVTVWPLGTARPDASNINFTAGNTTANAVMATIGVGGQVSFGSFNTSTHLVVDVTGWVTDNSADESSNRFTSIEPQRYLDTRIGSSGSGSAGAAVGPDSSASVLISGRAPLPVGGIGAVVVNVTVVEPTADGYITVYPNGGSVPNASTINFKAGRTVANQATVPVSSDGKIAVFNKSGATHVLVDVVGWWSGVPFVVVPPTVVPPSGPRCVVVLHGKGGTGYATRTRSDGATEFLPTGNASAPVSWGGYYQWLYASAAEYTSALKVITTALSTTTCGQIALAGFSNGGAMAAKVLCSGETFGGRLVGVVISDPVPDQVVDGCSKGAGVSTHLIQSDWMNSQVGSGRSCVADWTCQGNLYSLADYAAKLGNPPTTRIATHSQGDLGSYATTWWR